EQATVIFKRDEGNLRRHDVPIMKGEPDGKENGIDQKHRQKQQVGRNQKIGGPDAPFQPLSPPGKVCGEVFSSPGLLSRKKKSPGREDWGASLCETIRQPVISCIAGSLSFPPSTVLQS